MTGPGNSVLISETQIQQRVAELATEISQDYTGQSLTVIAVLKGSFIFIADLIRHFDSAILVEVEFMRVSSYGDGVVSSGELRIEQDVECSLENKNVLIVEDIVDSGLTLGAVKNLLASRQPRSLRIVTLLVKETSRRQPVALDYVGFQIPDVFVVGYGLDFAQRYRNLKEIRILDAG
jgi:hypoxanthine phosphoribosyltransferase